MTSHARLLSDGHRLHLQHGPIDLVIGVDGDDAARLTAFEAAEARFRTILTELIEELPRLRQPLKTDSASFSGEVAVRMALACRPHMHGFVTPMAAVAGAVADTLLDVVWSSGKLTRAYVNNGGDIALRLTPGVRFRMAIRGHDNAELGMIDLAQNTGIGGVATSGRHGRSLSMGIADSVTVLAETAACADVAATLIANAVDLPDHAAIRRVPAHEIDPDSDLGDRPVVTAVGPLSGKDVSRALETGYQLAADMQGRGHITAAALFLNKDIRLLGPALITPARRLMNA